VRVDSVLLQPGDDPVQIGTTFLTVEESDTGDVVAAFQIERAERPERTKITLPLRPERDPIEGKGLHRVVRKSRQMQLAITRALAYARLPRPVLLIGETGTGKEVLARLIHENGPNPSGPLLAVNCATLPRELISSELFGIEDGVATGVRARRGLFAEAEGGTLFLDEIGEIDAEMQSKLLRALEEHAIRPAGARRLHSVRLRVILATNNPDAVRRDLFFRCKRIVLSPLRERPEDIGPLAQHFLQSAWRSLGIPPVAISRRAVALLAAQPWPGNARELCDKIEDAVLLYGSGEMLHVEHIAEVLGVPEGGTGTSLRDRKDVLTRDAVALALEENGRNKSAAARQLGMSRNGIRKAIRRLGLDET
jgi:transcriptional regulator with PAS, ATPase and Fis domain